MAKEFYEIGREDGTIDVKISYRIIQLFSEGLYSSPNKAVEELVTNSFDAGATDVHIVLSSDLRSDDASIAVLDNGVGMDRAGLERHWLIGESDKREKNYKSPLKRNQIGQFGIGKLATYVLANRLTHISKVGGKYYSTSMDFTRIEHNKPKGIHVEKKVFIPFRELSNAEAMTAVNPWIVGRGKGHKVLRLFGAGASKHWTVAIMSDLKDMGKAVQRGRLNWILRTAMPLRDDFRLFVDGDRILPSKIDINQLEHLIIGKEVIEIPNPAPDDLAPLEDKSLPRKSEFHYGLDSSVIGRVTGYIDLYQDHLTGKSDMIGRSYGFFVYVRGRLINADDEYFGLDSNRLRHGTFSRFHMRVNIDVLDSELRSSRESVLQGPIYKAAQNFLYGAFNLARQKLQETDQAAEPSARLSARVASSPPDLTKWPVIELVQAVFDGTASSRYTLIPTGLSNLQKSKFIKAFKARTESLDDFVTDVILEDLTARFGIAAYEASSGRLLINSLHPFVAYNLDAYEDKKISTPLKLIALGEVLLEAQLHQLGVSQNTIDDILHRRDEMLRYFSHASGQKTPRVVAQELEDSSDNKDALERALVSAFDSMGFDAVPKGGPGKPDGIASAELGAQKHGVSDSYKVSLEAKSSKEVDKKVSAKEVGVSGIARQRDKFKCDHALVVGPDFPTSKEENALVTEIHNSSYDKDEPQTPKTITLIRIADLARLVRIRPHKQVNLLELRKLFVDCVTPQDCSHWIDEIEKSKLKKQYRKVIVETIWSEQKDDSRQQVTYDALRVALRKDHDIKLAVDYLRENCKSIASLVPKLVRARGASVSLLQNPRNVLSALKSEAESYQV